MVKASQGWPTRWPTGATVPKGGTVTPFIAVAIAALAVGFEALVQWKWGAMGIIAFLALTIGVKSKNVAIGGIGAVILVMLLAQSG
ncbi:hypothetical protein [Streptomyces pseudovenezuelae]|uniref:hypothetical protein n=1 Tax=Streptomyces pseudovenezuelae TaxID=67350 RepID=UPI0036E83542